MLSREHRRASLSDAPWTGSLTGSAYEFLNQADVGAIRIHFLMKAPGVEGPLTQGDVPVDLAVWTEPQDDVSGAGLILDFRDATGDDSAFVARASPTTWRGERLMRMSVSDGATDENALNRAVAAMLRCHDQVCVGRATRRLTRRRAGPRSRVRRAGDLSGRRGARRRCWLPRRAR